MKKILREVLPPFIIKLFRNCSATFSLEGHYPDWHAAENDSLGYKESVILEKVKHAMRKVVKGEAVAERDSVILDEIPYSWPVLATILRAVKDKNVHVVDFGGGLGCSFWYYKDWFEELKITWSIIEQKHYLECGRQNFESGPVKFVDSFADISDVNVVLFSSVLQYLEDPWEILNQAIKSNTDFICVDRTIFSKRDEERIAVQKVSKKIFPAEIPIRLIPVQKVKDYLSKAYILIAEYDSMEAAFGYNCKGLIFKHI